MKKFKQLLKYITELNLVAEEKIDAFVSNCELQISGAATTTTARVAAHKTYTASFSIEEYQGDADRLLAHFTCWLYENDQSELPNVDLPEASFDIEPVDDYTSDVVADIPFAECITLEQDDNGEFTLDGKKYRLAEPQINTAETVNLQGEVSA